jgi:hypothetical protein
MLPKLHHLYLMRNGNFTLAQRQQLETLDRVRPEGTLHAENKCQKLAMGNVDFLPEVDLAKKCRWRWQQVVKKREGKRISTSLIRQKAQQCGIVCPLSVTLAQAHYHFQAADKAYDTLKHHAPTHRYKFLCDCMASKSGDVPVAAQQVASRMLQQEKQRSDARRLKRVLAKVQDGAIARIKVLEDGIYIEKTDQAEVEHHTMEMCSACFQLTEDTPLQ